MKRKRKRQKETSHKQDEKFQESQRKHIVVVGFDNNTISNITIIDVANDDNFLREQISKSLN